MGKTKENLTSILVQLPKGLYDRIPGKKKPWATGVLIAAAMQLPEVERDSFGTPLRLWVFKTGDVFTEVKAKTPEEAFEKVGWDRPSLDKWGLKEDAIRDGWYTPKKSITVEFLEEI